MENHNLEHKKSIKRDKKTPWYSRGYLPHFDTPNGMRHIVFSLADAVPKTVVDAWKKELNWRENLSSDDAGVLTLRKRIDHYEDQCHGKCQLRYPHIGDMVQNALIYFDGERYALITWCVMPNHVHVLMERYKDYPVGKVVQSWKSYTAKRANDVLGRTGKFWMNEYFDRYIRSEKHFRYVYDYIANNPVKAGLVKQPDEWPLWGTRLKGE